MRYSSFTKKKDILGWINDGSIIVSNHDGYVQEVNELVEYKEKNKRNYKPRKNGKSAYENIYAHCLVFLIPYSVPHDEWKTFVKKYAETISGKYKNTKKRKGLLWCCKFFTINEANYAELICFTRRVYDNPKTVYLKYNQDYWYTKDGKRSSSEEHAEGDELKAKKGDYKLDKNGKRIRKVIAVKETEEDPKAFRYSDWDKFITRFKRKWIKIAKKYNEKRYEYTLISRVTVHEDDSNSMRKMKLKINKEINEINMVLIKYQEGINNIFIHIDDINASFHNFLIEVDEMIHKRFVKFSKIKEFMQKWWVENVAGEWLEDPETAN